MAASVFILGGNIGFAAAPVVIMGFLTYFDLVYLPVFVIPAVIVTAFFYKIGLHKVNLRILLKVNKSYPKTCWYKSKELFILNTAMAFRCWVQVAVCTYIPVLLMSGGYSSFYTGCVLSIFLTGNAVGAVGMGYLGGRYDRRLCILFTLVVGILSMYVFFACYSLGKVYILLLVVGGAGLQGAMPLSLTWAQDIIPDNAAMASGMMLGLAYG